MSLVPSQLNLNSYQIRSDTNKGLKLFNKYNLPDLTPAQNQILQFNSDGTAQFSNLPTSPSVSKFSHNVYVSSTSGTDVGNSSGGITTPYLTISNALASLDTVADTIPVVIHLAAGSYNESVTVIRSNTSISGSSMSQPNATVINGSVSFNMTPTTLQYTVGGLENVQVNSFLQHFNNTVYPNSIVVNNCIIVPPAQKNAIITSGTGNGILGDMTL